jgi:hypothetical protein
MQHPSMRSALHASDCCCFQSVEQFPKMICLLPSYPSAHPARMCPEEVGTPPVSVAQQFASSIWSFVRDSLALRTRPLLREAL